MARLHAEAAGDHQRHMNEHEPHPTIEQLLITIEAELTVSGETKQELLAELRDHLHDAWETAVANGEDEVTAVKKVTEHFGGAGVGKALQRVHAQWESGEAILACLIPVFAALVLRWLLFAPGGSVAGWQNVLVQPAFWIVALAVLLVPVLYFQRWRYILINWTFFWLITIIFALIPAATSW
jgi:hypothetical protein